MAPPVIVNEVLNYAVFNIKCITKDTLLDTIAKFYH